ncbi:TRAP transporter substrate-binding protein DctP [Mesobacillus maritimus]|uniref:TRAP transporter substrate-binding protein DctP n=1 Tax=Mesobacillus maritimus TaxID=1643336 RepID=UPI00204159AD|nr:TRAP transporter substrate-binding protein DctP [Mesobacillus maritimus]MCM3668677.1 TRAP transporter substrate-binding protein DctP [Mesobacillus maritimus]
MCKMVTLKKIAVYLIFVLLLGLIAGCGDNQSASSSEGDGNSKSVTLKLAHQWAGPQNGTGDYRSLLAERFAEEVEKASDGSIKIQVFPANSLVKATEQYDSLNSGAIDMAIWAPFYDAGKVPEFSITLLPGIIQSFDQAWQWKDEEVGKEFNRLLEDNGVKNLVWGWGTMAIATKNKEVISPEDLKGLKIRGAGKDTEKMLSQLGAGITSMASSEIYSALQTNTIDGTLTSFDSFLSYRIYEVVDYFNYTGGNSFLYSANPLVISNHAWENKLSSEQQQIIEKVSADLQDWVKETAIESNSETVQVFRDNGVKVHEMTPEESQEWFDAAQPIVEEFAQTSDTANELVEAAKKLHK